MAERHTVDFGHEAFNILTDHERRRIILQFERGVCIYDPSLRERLPILAWGRSAARRACCVGCDCSPSPRFAMRIVKPVRRRFGDLPANRLVRWLLRRGPSPLVPARRLRPHPDNSDVICWDLAVCEGRRPEEALAALLDVFRGPPGYHRTIGPPLDPDESYGSTSDASTSDASMAAMEVLRRLIQMHRDRICVEEDGCDDVVPVDPDAVSAADPADPGASASQV